MARPGVMIYFDFLLGINRLEPLQRCRMYDSIMAYGQYGEVPEFEDPAMAMLWEMLRPKLDADQRSYETKVAKNREAAKIRWKQSNANGYEREQERETEIETETEIEREKEIYGEEILLTNRKETRGNASLASSRSGFPPSVTEIRDYCIQMGLSVDPEYFFNFYEAVGWMTRSGPVHNWKGMIQSWDKSDQGIL